MSVGSTKLKLTPAFFFQIQLLGSFPFFIFFVFYSAAGLYLYHITESRHHGRLCYQNAHSKRFIPLKRRLLLEATAGLLQIHGLNPVSSLSSTSAWVAFCVLTLDFVDLDINCPPSLLFPAFMPLSVCLIQISLPDPRTFPDMRKTHSFPSPHYHQHACLVADNDCRKYRSLAEEGWRWPPTR